jgi:hypothetical protein
MAGHRPIGLPPDRRAQGIETVPIATVAGRSSYSSNLSDSMFSGHASLLCFITLA